MKDYIWQIISGALLASNGAWWIFFRATKREKEANADSAAIDAKQKNIDLQQDQYDYLLGKLTTFQKEYIELSEELQRKTREFTEAINQKCYEITELKGEIARYRIIRCYELDCEFRKKSIDEKKD